MPWILGSLVFKIYVSSLSHLTLPTWFVALLFPQIACHKLQLSWPCNRKDHLHGKPWLSTQQHISSKNFPKFPLGYMHVIKLVPQPTHVSTFWKWKPSSRKFDLGNNIPKYIHNNFTTSIQKCGQCNHPRDDVLKRQQDCECWNNSTQWIYLGRALVLLHEEV